MIKLPSLRDDYSVIFSGDPALDLPAVPTLADDASDEQKADAKKIADERERLLKVARETGQWDSLIKPGEKPTVFQMRHLSGSARDYLDGEVARKQLAPGEFASLVFRLAIKRIDNLGDIAVKHERMSGFSIASIDVIDRIRAFPGIGDSIVAEVGGVVAMRTYQPLDPL